MFEKRHRDPLRPSMCLIDVERMSNSMCELKVLGECQSDVLNQYFIKSDQNQGHRHA